LESKKKKKKKRIDKILEKKIKYDEKYSKEKKEKELKRIENITKNNFNALNSTSKIIEPKAKFYTPKSFILSNKGFTFGHKYSGPDKIAKKDYPEFPLFKDDFEKILLKNKKIIHTSTGKRFPEYEVQEIIDDSKLRENQEKYDRKREMNRMNKTMAFKEKREDWKEKVHSNKKEITLKNDNMLDEYIKRTYKGDKNFFMREINYTQVENASPKYSFREKTDFGSVFTKEPNSNNDTNYNKSTKVNTLYLENPDITYTRLRYPNFSFGKSKRFNSTSDNFQEKSDYFTNTDYNYTQSFLKAQTYMGTGKKLEMKYNGVPGPNVYKIKRFADDVVEKSNKFNLNKIKLKNIDNSLENK